MAPCCDSSRSPVAIPASYLFVCLLFLAPRPSASLAGAVEDKNVKGDGGEEREEARGAARGRSGVLIGRPTMIKVPLWDSQGCRIGGVSGISDILLSALSSSGVTALALLLLAVGATVCSALSFAVSTLSVSLAPVRPRASALP
jgi:hypothetical protein